MLLESLPHPTFELTFSPFPPDPAGKGGGRPSTLGVSQEDSLRQTVSFAVIGWQQGDHGTGPTVNDENPCGNRGSGAVCPPVASDGTDGEKWRRRESNPRVHSSNSLIAQRLWNMLQDVGVSWEWNDDANRQPLALGHEELAEVITAWPLLSADLRQAILAIVRSVAVAEEVVARTP